MEIVRMGNTYEVWDYYGNRVFDGTEAECEQFIDDND